MDRDENREVIAAIAGRNSAGVSVPTLLQTSLTTCHQLPKVIGRAAEHGAGEHDDARMACAAAVAKQAQIHVSPYGS